MNSEYRLLGIPAIAPRARRYIRDTVIDQNNDTDAALAVRTLRGEDDAFAGLMSRHKGWVYRFVRRYVGNHADAYDVLQDTFFAAWRGLSRYETDRPFAFWLRRIALNKCRDRNRREVVRRLIGGSAPGTDGDAADVVDPAADPSRLAESGQELGRLEAQIHKLPRSLKEPLLLTALEGMSQQQAGEFLGVSAKAVETRVYRARARLLELQDMKPRRG
jgi:RNA polymerase sigma-70 factor (ECF subfamily)